MAVMVAKAMTKKKYKTRPRLTEENAVLVNAIDVFANGLLKEASEANDPPLPLLTKLDVLDKLARWVAVRNKVAAPNEPDDNEGGQLDVIRSRLKARNAAGRTYPPLGERPGDFVTHRYGRRAQEEPRDGDGADLASLKARLPRADDGGDDGNRDDAGGSDDPVFRDGGSVRADVPGDQSGDDNGADRGGNV